MRKLIDIPVTAFAWLGASFGQNLGPSNVAALGGRNFLPPLSWCCVASLGFFLRQCADH